MPVTPRRLLVAALSAAIAATTLQAQSPTPSMPGYPAVGSPATVTLLSPGAEPRTRLRYRIPAGQKNTMVMSMAMGVSISMAGMNMPAMELPVMKMTADIVTTSAAPNGDVTYEVTFTNMTAEGPPGMDPSIVAMMQAASSGIIGLKASATVNDRGINRGMKLDLDKLTDPTLRQALSSLSGSLESMSMPLPEEPVGAGARWEVRQAIRANDVHTFQRVECELASVEGPVVNLKIKIEQNAPRQPVSNPMLPPGATIEIEKMTGTGSGTMALRLDGIVPTSDVTSVGNAAMIMNMGGQPQSLNTETRLKVTVAPGK